MADNNPKPGMQGRTGSSTENQGAQNKSKYEYDINKAHRTDSKDATMGSSPTQDADRGGDTSRQADLRGGSNAAGSPNTRSPAPGRASDDQTSCGCSGEPSKDKSAQDQSRRADPATDDAKNRMDYEGGSHGAKQSEKGIAGAASQGASKGAPGSGQPDQSKPKP